MTLDPQLAQLLEMLAALGAKPMEQSTPQEARAAFWAMTAGAVQPDDVVDIYGSTDVEIAGRPARIYCPDEQGEQATIVYFHGGGFVIGDIDTHDQSCRRLCRDTGSVVISIDYPLAPEDRFPAGVEHALAATAHILENLDEYGGARPVAVAGDSAGGNLAAVVAQALRDRIDAQLLIYPATAGEGDYPSRAENADGYFLTASMMMWFAEQYLPEGADLSDPRFAPVAGDLVGLPDAVVATAEYDPLRDEGDAYARAMATAGTKVDHVSYPGMIHGFADMVTVSQGAAGSVADLHARFKSLLDNKK